MSLQRRIDRLEKASGERGRGLRFVNLLWSDDGTPRTPEGCQQEKRRVLESDASGDDLVFIVYTDNWRDGTP
jgi:hypothetical protein